MKKSMKLLLSAVLLFGILIVGTSAKAVEAEAFPESIAETKNNGENSPPLKMYHLREVSITRGVQIPTDTWDFSTKGRYELEGSSNSTDLYTEYRFTGSNTYKIYLENNFTRTRTVKCCRASDGNVLYTFKVPANGSISTALSTEHVWYMLFPAGIFDGGGIDVKGYIEP